MQTVFIGSNREAHILYAAFLCNNCSYPAGETDKILNKWDNHNTIARGWAGVEANYHPVTFRKMYNVDTQKQAAAL